MDIFNNMSQRLDKPVELPTYLVCPIVKELPKDSFLHFRTVETASDTVTHQPPSMVTMFRDDQAKLLKMLCEFSDIIGVNVVVVSGVPDAYYSAEFEAEVWSKNSTAYHSLVADLSEAARRAEHADQQVKDSSRYANEQSVYTRKNGSVKEFNSFQVQPGKTETDLDAADDDNS